MQHNMYILRKIFYTICIFYEKYSTHVYMYYEPFLALLVKEKKEEIRLSPMTKAPTPTEMSKGQSDNTNNATKKFD